MATEKNANNGGSFRSLPVKGPPPLKDLECAASEAITLHIVDSVDQIPSDGSGAASCSSDQGGIGKAGGVMSFHPPLTHQLFGDEERIYGYKGLKVDIWLHSFTFHAFFQMKYDSMIHPRGKKRKADNVLATFKEHFPGKVFEDRESFAKAVAAVDADEILRQGTPVIKGARPDAGFIVPVSGTKGGESGKEGSSVADQASVEILRFNFENPAVIDWHVRMEPLVLFFIDGSSFIDAKDKRWELLVAVERSGSKKKEKLGSSDKAKSAKARVTGFCTMYSFYHYPESTRIRLSQLMVLPPFQGKGYGGMLMRAVNMIAVERDCFDVTVEDPTDEFQWMMDAVDVERIISLPSVAKSLGEAVDKAKTVNEKPMDTSEAKYVSRRTRLGVPTNLWEEVRNKMKINRKQLRRSWEVAVYIHLDMEHPAVKQSFRQLVTARLKAEHFGADRPSEKDKRKETVITGIHDDLPMFVMMTTSKRRKIASNRGVASIKKTSQKVVGGGDGSVSAMAAADDEAGGGMPSENQTAEEKDLAQAKALDELFQERLEEIKIIADKVDRRAKRRSSLEVVSDCVTIGGKS